MEIIYKAFDGEEFEDYELCKQHEIKEKLSKRPYAIFADKDGNIIPAEEVIENSERGTDIYYIFYKNRDAYENGNELLAEYCKFYVPEPSGHENQFSKPCGVWWDNHKDSWVDVEERLAELEKQKDIYEKLMSLREEI